MDATKGMVDKKMLAKAKDGVIVINAARDALVNDDDMKEALASGKVRKYVTDFPNYKTANMEGVVAISHLGASTEEAEDNCAAMAAEEIINFVENGNIINSVNYPRIDLGKKEATRVVVLFEGDHVEEVSKLLAGASKVGSGIKGNFGAVVADVKSVDEAKLKAVPGVTRVLVL